MKKYLPLLGFVVTAGPLAIASCLWQQSTEFGYDPMINVYGLVLFVVGFVCVLCSILQQIPLEGEETIETIPVTHEEYEEVLDEDILHETEEKPFEANDKPRKTRVMKDRKSLLHQLELDGAELELEALGVKATARAYKNQLLIKAGSQARLEHTASTPEHVLNARAEMQVNGILIVDDKSPNVLTFTEDYADAPGTATSIITGRSATAYENMWKVKKTGTFIEKVRIRK